MALISMRQLLDHAAEHDYGVPAGDADRIKVKSLAVMQAACDAGELKPQLN